MAGITAWAGAAAAGVVTDSDGRCRAAAAQLSRWPGGPAPAGHMAGDSSDGGRPGVGGQGPRAGLHRARCTPAPGQQPRPTRPGPPAGPGGYRDSGPWAVLTEAGLKSPGQAGPGPRYRSFKFAPGTSS